MGLPPVPGTPAQKTGDAGSLPAGDESWLNPKGTKKKRGVLGTIEHIGKEALTSNYTPHGLAGHVGLNLLREIKDEGPGIGAGLLHVPVALAHDAAQAINLGRISTSGGHVHASTPKTWDVAEIGKGAATQYSKYYTGKEYDPKTGKWSGGGFGGLMHNLYTKPLQPLMDVMTVATLGGGLAAKAGELGMLGERGALLGKAGTRGWRITDSEAPGGFREVTVPTSSNPTTRALQNLRHAAFQHGMRAVEGALGHDVGWGEAARGIKQEVKLQRRARDTETARAMRPFDDAFRGLSSAEETAISLKAQGLVPANYIPVLENWLKAAEREKAGAKGLRQSREMTQQIKAHKRMLAWVKKVTPEMYDSVLTDPRLATAHAAASALMKEAADQGIGIGLLDPVSVAQRPYLALRVIDGFKYTPLEDIAQAGIEALPARNDLFSVIDSLAPNPQVAANMKTIIEQKFRADAHELGLTTPEEVVNYMQQQYEKLQGISLSDQYVPEELAQVRSALAQSAQHYDQIGRQEAIDSIQSWVDDLRAKGIATQTKHTHPFPPWAETPEGIAQMVDKLTFRALEGKIAKTWYTDSGHAIMKAAKGSKKRARVIARLVAITSPQQRVFQNVRSAIMMGNKYKEVGREAWDAEVAKGLADTTKSYKPSHSPIHVPGYMSWDQYAAGSKIMQGLNEREAQYLGQKTGSFYKNFLQEFDPVGFEREFPGEKAARGPVTFDTWMRRALDYETGLSGKGEVIEPISPTQYGFGEHVVSKIADAIGWKPHEAQAAIWTSIKDELEGKRINERTGAYNVRDALQELKDKGTVPLFQRESDPFTFPKNEPRPTVQPAPVVDPALTGLRPPGKSLAQRDSGYAAGDRVRTDDGYLGTVQGDSYSGTHVKVKRDVDGVVEDYHTTSVKPSEVSNALPPRGSYSQRVMANSPTAEPGGIRGLYTPKGDGSAVMHFGKSAAEDTVMHEFGHHVRTLLEQHPREADAIANKLHVPRDAEGNYVWDTYAEEQFANAYVGWLRDKTNPLGRSLQKNDYFRDFGEVDPTVSAAFDKIHSSPGLKGSRMEGGRDLVKYSEVEGLIAHPHIGRALKGKAMGGAGGGEPLKPGLSRLNRGIRLATSQWLPGPEAFRSAYVKTIGYVHAKARQEYAFRIGRKLDDPGDLQPGWYAVRSGKGNLLRSEKDAAGLDEAYQQFQERDGGDLQHYIEHEAATQDPATINRWKEEGDTVRQISPTEHRAIFGEYKQAHKFIQRYFDRPTDFWRTLTLTYRPAWVVNNFVGQTLLYAVNHAGHGAIRHYMEAARNEARGQSNLPDDLRFSGQARVEAAQLRPAVRAISRWEHRMRERIQRFNASLSDNVPRAATYKAILAKMEKTNEDAGRLRKLMEETKGDTTNLGDLRTLHDQVVQETLDQLIDFNNLSNFERQYIRRAVPFYSWIKGITKATGKLGFEHPGRMLILLLLARDGIRVQQGDFGEGYKAIPGFLPIGKTVKGVVGGLSTTGLNPWATPGQVAGMLTGGLSTSVDPADNPFLQANPALQAVLTGAAGVDLFTRKPLDHSRLGTIGRELVGAPPQVALLRDLLHPKNGAKKLSPQTRWDLLLRYAGYPQSHKRISTAKSIINKPPGK